MRRWPRPQAPQTNWFAAATVIAAITVVFCGGGLGGSPPVGEQIEPLTLTLSAPQICETTYPKGGWTHGLEWNEEEQAWEDIVDEAWWYWDSVGTMEVEWAASGGDGVYTVTIAGETHNGPSGIAEVSCAMWHGPITNHPEWGRIHVIENPQWGQLYGEEEKPIVDAGVKMITATVVDGSGATAEASVDVYALLSPSFEDVLRAGETYRLRGDWVATIPDDTDGQCCGYEVAVCEPVGDDGVFDESIVCEDAFQVVLYGEGYRAIVGLGVESGSEAPDHGSRRVILDDDQATDAGEVLQRGHTAIDQLLATLVRRPHLCPRHQRAWSGTKCAP